MFVKVSGSWINPEHVSFVEPNGAHAVIHFIGGKWRNVAMDVEKVMEIIAVSVAVAPPQNSRGGLVPRQPGPRGSDELR